MSDKTNSGKIITFYSFKGGTGRSMALANVAWILAANDKKVLAIDWDLEAPGLHYYFRPFLNDKELEETPGLIDLVWDWSDFMLTPEDDRPPVIKEKPLMLADAQRYRVCLEFPFTESKGCLHFLGAGKQDNSYTNRVRGFDWNAFYARLGGRTFLDAFRKRLKEQYDFVLIDSRTGIADIAGICTIHMPDSVVLCFTYNQQSIRGIAAVAQSIFDQPPEVELLPVPMRIIRGQQKQLEEAKCFAREKLNRFLPKSWVEKQIEDYWINSKVSFEPDYAWHETLAVLRHPPTERDTMLSDMQWLAGQIAGSDKPLLTRELNPSLCKEYLAEFELHASREEMGTLYEVPSFPLNYLPRSDALDSLKESVLGSSNQPVGVYGTSGVGKSALVAAFALQEKVRRAFPGGIYWLTLGQEGNVITKQGEFVQMLGQQPVFEDYRQGCEKLIELTRGRACLVILDDIWTEKQVRAFTELGQRCRLLVTTNNQEMLKGIGAQEVPLDAPEPAQALVLLANSAGQSVNALSAEANAVVEKCNRIPLALTVLGALVQKNNYSWHDVLDRLDAVDPQRLRGHLPAYKLPDGLLGALQVSIESLPEKEKKAFLDCAVFPENASIPEAALQKLWSGYLAESEAAKVAQYLTESSLLSRDKKRCRLHDLYHYFLRTSAENLPMLHRQLLGAYLRDCRYGDWSSGPNDGYFFQHLPYHLFKACDDNLRTLLLNYNWIAAKLKATNIQAVIADYTDYETVLGDDESIHLVQRALRLSADTFPKI